MIMPYVRIYNCGSSSHLFHTWLVLFLITVLCVHRSSQEISSQNTNTLLQSRLGTEGKKQRPNNGGPPINVILGLEVESLGSISAATADFSLTIYLYEFWHDPRLMNTSLHHIILKGDDVDLVWTPDIFFLNEKESKMHDVTVTNKLIYIRPNGSVWMSMRVSVVLACHMSLQFFPMDSQACGIMMSSYAYDVDDMTLSLTKDYVYIDKDIDIPVFNFLGYEVRNDTILSQITGRSFSTCEIIVEFERQMQAYLLTVYIPSCILVSIAWLSFWIDARAAPARITLGITTVLTVTTMTSGILERLPIVTYAKAIDIWLAACLLFVFLCLLEYAWANYLIVLEQSRIKKRKSMRLAKRKEAGRIADLDDVCSETLELEYRNERHLTANRLDKVSRFLFPIAFVLFNLVYWSVYLHKGDQRVEENEWNEE